MLVLSEWKVEQKGNLKVNLFRVSLSHMHGRLNFQLKSMAAAALAVKAPVVVLSI